MLDFEWSAGLGHGDGSTIRSSPASRTDADADPRLRHSKGHSPGLRVLVADDNRDGADTLALLLELIGHEVRIAYDGRAAVALAQAFRPDAALLDIGMPELDGYEVARAFRAEPWGKAVHLIAITGWGQERDRREAQAAGFDNHLTKPVDPQVLEELLASFHRSS